MRDAAVDVDTERTLIIVERLARLLGRHQGFKVGADGSINVYPSSLRVRLPAEKQEGPPRPAKRDSRSGCHRGSTRAPNARTRRSAARAATHAQRRAQAEDRLQLPAGNLASKVWASVRVATRLLAWRVRVRARASPKWKSMLDEYVERAASLGTRKAVRVTEIPNHTRAGPGGAPFRTVVALPILVGRLLVQQWPSNRQPPRRPQRRAAPPPATQLAALAPPSQQPTLALAAAARATLDPSELQESRGSKREALARTPPSAPPPTRVTRDASRTRSLSRATFSTPTRAPTTTRSTSSTNILFAIPRNLAWTTRLCHTFLGNVTCLRYWPARATVQTTDG